MDEKLNEDRIKNQLECAMIVIQSKLSESIGHHNEIKIIDVKIGNLKTRCTFFTEIIKEE